MSIRTHEAERTRNLTINFPDHQASWRTRKGGWAEINITAHKQGKWLSINSVETADTGAVKQTFITLDAEQLQALRTLLQVDPVQEEQDPGRPKWLWDAAKAKWKEEGKI